MESHPGGAFLFIRKVRTACTTFVINKKAFHLHSQRRKAEFRGTTLIHRISSDALIKSVTGFPVQSYFQFTSATPGRVQKYPLLPCTIRQVSEKGNIFLLLLFFVFIFNNSNDSLQVCQELNSLSFRSFIHSPPILRALL